MSCIRRLDVVLLLCYHILACRVHNPVACRVQGLEQAVYSLERRLEQRALMERAHLDDAEGLRSQLAHARQESDATDIQHQARERHLNRQVLK